MGARLWRSRCGVTRPWGDRMRALRAPVLGAHPYGDPKCAKLPEVLICYRAISALIVLPFRVPMVLQQPYLDSPG